MRGWLIEVRGEPGLLDHKPTAVRQQNRTADLTHGQKQPVALRVLKNMSRLRSVAWLEGERETLLDLDGRGQAVAVELALASGLERETVLEPLGHCEAAVSQQPMISERDPDPIERNAKHGKHDDEEPHGQ